MEVIGGNRLIREGDKKKKSNHHKKGVVAAVLICLPVFFLRLVAATITRQLLAMAMVASKFEPAKMLGQEAFNR